MYYFELPTGEILANADSPKWLKYLYDRYPEGEIKFKPLPADAQPVVTGAQTL